MKKICHITTVHERYDVRIFVKELLSLSHRYDCTLIAPGEHEETKDGIRIIPIKKYKPEYKRFLKTTREAYKKAKEQRADLYHFHDPEFLPWAILLKFSGKKIVYDIHENHLSSIMNRDYLPKISRYIFCGIYWLLQEISFTLFDGIIVVVKEHMSSCPKSKTILLPNYPELKLFKNLRLRDSKRGKDNVVNCLYLGGMTRIRGIYELIRAVILLNEKRVRYRLNLIGRISEGSLEQFIMESSQQYDFIVYHGRFERKKALELAGQNDIGIITVYPTKNNMISSPNKLFEYLALGLGVVASNFPKWHKILKDIDYVEYVDPQDINSIAEGIERLANKLKGAPPRFREDMRVFVFKDYSWESVESRLLELYERILNDAH